MRDMQPDYDLNRGQEDCVQGNFVCSCLGPSCLTQPQVRRTASSEGSKSPSSSVPVSLGVHADYSDV